MRQIPEDDLGIEFRKFTCFEHFFGHRYIYEIDKILIKILLQLYIFFIILYQNRI